MENSNTAAAATGGRRDREPSIDPVKAQGILTTVNRKIQHAARAWPAKWGFYSRIREIELEEALNSGMTLEEYHTALKLLSSKPEPRKYPIETDPSPSPSPLPPTSSGMIGHRAKCSLEIYGNLVRTSRDYPTRPPLPPGQVYDPYKQTMVFLGSVDGDPISYKLPVSRCEVTDMWTQPQQIAVTPFCFENL